MALQQFIKPIRSSLVESVAIWDKGQICLNKPLVMNKGLDAYKKVSLFFDPELQQMVFQFTNDETLANTSSVGITKNNTLLISAKTYLKYFGIENSCSKRYPAHFDDTNKVLTLALSEGAATTPRNTKKVEELESVTGTTPIQTTVEPVQAPVVELVNSPVPVTPASVVNAV